MSKRSASPSLVTPLKLVKLDDQWSIVPEPSTANTDSMDRSSFQLPPSGSKLRIQQVYVLSYKPRVEASISLNGNQPEVRFASEDQSICLTGDEFLQLANVRDSWPTNPIFLSITRLEPLSAGSCRFARYEKMNQVTDLSPAQEQDFFPTAIFDLSPFAVNRLKTKLDVMSRHVFRILESESTINVMFDCVVRAYKAEYARLVSLQPITAHFTELSRLVDSHVPTSQLVKDFCFNTAGSRWNHFNLLQCVTAQKQHIRSLLE